MNFMIFSVPVFALILEVFLHHFCLHFGTLFASICMLPRTLFLTSSFLFSKGCPVPFPPFGSTLVAFWHPFGSHLGSLCSLLAPFWSPLARRRSVWLRRRTFGFRCFPFVTCVLKFSLFFRDFPHLPLTFRIYILCAASRGPATALNHGYLWLMGKSQILSRCKT